MWVRHPALSITQDLHTSKFLTKTGPWWGTVCEEKSKCDFDWNVRWVICGGEALGKGNSTLLSSSGFIPWPGRLAAWLCLGCPGWQLRASWWHIPLYCSFLQSRRNCGQWLEHGRSKGSPGNWSCPCTMKCQGTAGSHVEFRPVGWWRTHSAFSLLLPRKEKLQLEWSGANMKNNNSKQSFNQGFGRDADSLPQGQLRALSCLYTMDVFQK